MMSCDCLNRCGDDSRVANGTVTPCVRWTAWKKRPRIVGVGRADNDPNLLVVIYDKPPTADDVRDLQKHDRWPWP